MITYFRWTYNGKPSGFSDGIYKDGEFAPFHEPSGRVESILSKRVGQSLFMTLFTDGTAPVLLLCGTGRPLSDGSFPWTVTEAKQVGNIAIVGESDSDMHTVLSLARTVIKDHVGVCDSMRSAIVCDKTLSGEYGLDVAAFRTMVEKYGNDRYPLTRLPGDTVLLYSTPSGTNNLESLKKYFEGFGLTVRKNAIAKESASLKDFDGMINYCQNKELGFSGRVKKFIKHLFCPD